MNFNGELTQFIKKEVLNPGHAFRLFPIYYLKRMQNDFKVAE